MYSLSSPFLEAMPRDVAEKLQKEFPDQTWEYGKDWVNLGYRPGWGPMIQGLAKADDWHEYLQTDANGTPIEDVPVMKNVKSLHNVPVLMEFTGLVGAFNAWIQFFQIEDHRPAMLHGCTSITIPEARSYFSSKQIVGLFEGVAGAAWYEELLNGKFENRLPGQAKSTNTGLAFAQLVIIAFIFLGNVGYVWKRFFSVAEDDA